ncbi:WD domain containing protein [Entamoeba marina]
MSSIKAKSRSNDFKTKKDKIFAFAHRSKSNIIDDIPINSTNIVGSIKDDKYLLTVITETVQQLNQLHSSMIWTITTSPNGKLLAVGGKDGVINIWSIKDGKIETQPLMSYTKHKGGSVTSKQEIFIWSVENGNDIQHLLISDVCMCMKPIIETDQLLIGLLNGLVELWDWKNNKVIMQYDVHHGVTAINCFNDEVSGTMFFVGNLQGSVFILYEYENKMQLVKQLDSKESSVVCGIEVHNTEPLFYVTYSTNKILIYSYKDMALIQRLKGMQIGGYAIKPILHDSKKLLLIGSKDNSLYVFPSTITSSHKKQEMNGFRLNLFVNENSFVVHVIQLPNTSNLLIVDKLGNAAVHSFSYDN